MAAQVRSLFLACPRQRVEFRKLLKSLEGPVLGLDIGSRFVGVSMSDAG